MNDESDDPYVVGYRRPPASTRFPKGHSGNRLGRPPGRRSKLPYDAVLGQQVTIREHGKESRVSAAEAFLLYMTKQGLERSSVATRKMAAAVEEVRAERRLRGEGLFVRIVHQVCAPGSVSGALEPLRMARKLDRYRDTARMALQPWIVEAALVRLGDKRLTKKEQEEVYRVTRTPKKVRWPNWWEFGNADDPVPTRGVRRRHVQARAKARNRTSGS